MNELSGALRILNTTVSTVKVLDIMKKAVIITACAVCGLYALRVWRK